MSMRVSPGRTYKFYTGTPVYAFGTGLSYTTFTCQWSGLPKGSLYKKPMNITFKDLQLRDVNYEVQVTNTGKVGGAISVLAYITSNVPGAPMKQLFNFEKVYLDPGASTHLYFTVGIKDFQLFNAQASLMNSSK